MWWMSLAFLYHIHLFLLFFRFLLLLMKVLWYLTLGFVLFLFLVVSYFSFNQRMVLSIFYLLKQLIYYHIYFLKVFIHTLTYIVNCKHAINVFLSFVLSHTGVLLPELCERQRSSPHRIMSELLSSGVASGPTSSKASIHRTASAPAPLWSSHVS